MLNRLLDNCKINLKKNLKEEEFFFENNCVVFFIVSTGQERAHIERVSGATFEESWSTGISSLKRWRMQTGKMPSWVRVEVVTSIEEMEWEELLQKLSTTKRNYFRFGLAFDKQLEYAVLEHELYANAILYKTDVSVSTPNEVNLKNYSKRRFKKELTWPENNHEKIWRFKTLSVFADKTGTYEIESKGRNSGYRKIKRWDSNIVKDVIVKSTHYLSKQVKNDGLYQYGWFPCFDRPIPTYNALRHASSTYALLEGWEITQDIKAKRSIDKALFYLESKLIKKVALPSGEQAAFLVDIGNEIKLGGNAVCILAYAKYTEITSDSKYIELMEQLALGILYMQDPTTGSYVHILNYPELTIKEEQRIIYYDGEAAFGLMRLYGLTKDERWINSVEKAFDYFIENKHWKAHDHWLSYCVNELTLYKPDPKYYKFGLDNIRDHLDFVLNRITTYPTLLELMMAAEKMIKRMQQYQDVSYLLEGFDVNKFYRALEYRARYLMNGFFFPEVAMFFKNPARIINGFFIRHHTFRVRIDDVEHYLSGYVAYLKYLESLSEIAKEKLPRENVIGYLCYPKNPSRFAEVNLLAEESASRCMVFLYISYNNFDIYDGRVKGFLYRSGEWVEGYYLVPEYIDNAPPNSEKQKEIYYKLQRSSKLLCHRLGDKEKVKNFLSKNTSLSRCLLDSSSFTVEKMLEMLESSKSVIVKNKRSSQGRGVLLVQKEDSVYCISDGNEKTFFERKNARYILGKYESSGWILQKYIASLTKSNNRPFDIRVGIYRQNKENLWAVANPYARIGSNDVTSNLATGGVALPGKQFLLEEYPKKYSMLLKQLSDTSRIIAQTLQSQVDFPIDALGIDYGIEDGKLYLFEVNTYPGMKGNMKQVIKLKVNYYQDLLELRK